LDELPLASASGNRNLNAAALAELENKLLSEQLQLKLCGRTFFAFG
jgi:hypothetical protein